MLTVETSRFQVAPDLKGDTRTDTKLLREMAERVERFVGSMPWTPPIQKLFLAYGVGGILALFLVRFPHPVERYGERDFWVVVGDIPPAIMTDEVGDPVEVLEHYSDLMEDWADKAIAGADVSDCYTVNAPPTPKFGRMLKSRLEYIREKLIPEAREQLG